MNALPALIALQANGPSGPDPLGSFLVPMALVFFIFYFLVIRPQSRQRKQQEAMLKGVEKGDAVVTKGGIHGKVTGVTDDVLTLEIASVKGEKVRIKVSRPAVESVKKAKGDGAS